MVTDAIVRLEGDHDAGLIYHHFLSSRFFSPFFKDYKNVLDVSPDLSVVVVGNRHVVIAHNTVTGAMLWRKELQSSFQTFCIHGGLVVLPVHGCDTVLLDVTTGHQLHSMPTAWINVHGICVFDGM